MSNVILKHISHSYDRVRVLENVDLTIGEGEFYTLLGPSGCGKTTLLRILAGFITPSEGEVWIGDQNITDHGPEKRNMGIVFQNYALFPNMTVRENISYGLRVRRLPKNVQRDRCDYYMELAGMKEYADRRIQDLSGGQQQRVAIARALVIEPRMLLLDEPMSNLDVALRVKMREEIRSIQKKVGITTLFITHDQQEALSISDKISVMRDGHVLQVGTPDEIYNTPNQEFVANFVGTSNLLDGRYVRPEQMQLLKSGDGIPARVTGIRFSGVYYEYTVTSSAREYKVIELNDGSGASFKAGDPCFVSVKPEVLSSAAPKAVSSGISHDDAHLVAISSRAGQSADKATEAAQGTGQKEGRL